MSFIVYDVSFMVLFTIAVVLFLYKNRKNLTREGWVYLYPTQLGVRLIESTSKRYARILRPMQYAVVSLGYILMGGIIGLMVYTVYLYIRYPIVSKLISAPPVFPIFPYFTEFFGLESFFPPFYFTYFIVSLVLVAVVHEFSHGIFARLNKIRIHSTGFAFFGPVLGAFVQQDDKDMEKAGKFAQLSVLAAGVFANIVLAALVLLVFWGFFVHNFSPQGFIFSDYARDIVNTSQIVSVEGISVAAFTSSTLAANATLIHVSTGNQTYVAHAIGVEQALEQNYPLMEVYQDSPALEARLAGIITSIDDMPIHTREDLVRVLDSHKPGDNVTITTLSKENEEKKTNITLADRNGKAFLGVSSGAPGGRGIIGFFVSMMPKMNDYESATAYKSDLGEFGIFMFHLFWWVIMINFLVGLFNMLPLGMLDGGRFFMLTIWGLTGSKKAADISFKWITYFMLALFVLLMLKWVFRFF